MSTMTTEMIRTLAYKIVECEGNRVTELDDFRHRAQDEAWSHDICGPNHMLDGEDLAALEHLIKGATVTLAPDPLPAAPSEDHVLVRWTEQIWTNWNCQAWIDPVKYEEIVGEEIVEQGEIDENAYGVRMYLADTDTFFYRSDPTIDENNDEPWFDVENEGTPADHRAYEQSKLHPQGELEI